MAMKTPASDRTVCQKVRRTNARSLPESSGSRGASLSPSPGVSSGSVVTDYLGAGYESQPEA